MRAIFTLSVLVEPDRQRFSRFVLQAVQALGGSAFVAASRMSRMLSVLRSRRCLPTESVVEAQLLLDGRKLLARCADHTMELVVLAHHPEEATVLTLIEVLRDASETADPELLRKRNHKIKEDLERFMRVSAEQIAEVEAILERKQSELKESIRLAETDSLTGLLNRGAYDDRLDQAVRRASRQSLPLSLLLIDLDHFKQVNDTHGHQYGDQYLKRAAQAMREASREDVDHLCRIGGDEFAVIVYAAVTVAQGIAQRILELMEKRTSIGVAQVFAGDTPETLVARTDAALYEAKRRGRGQVVVDHSDGLGTVANP